MTIEELENQLKDLKEENKKLLEENDILHEEVTFYKDKIADRNVRITELEKGMEEALADLQYVL